MSLLAPTLQAFFTDRLLTQRQVSPATVAAYRDTLRLLLGFAQQRTGIPPSRLDFAEVDADLVTGFLAHLENQRGNGARTRNARLAAIHSLFRFAALHHPEHADQIARVLAVPAKRYDRALVCFLTSAEVDALLAAPDQTTWLGRRDHALLVLTIQTGLRVSEVTSLTLADVHVDESRHVRCHGKGRKERATPLTRQTAAVLTGWMRERGGVATEPVFPTRQGRRLSVDAIQWLLAKHTRAAAQSCPSLHPKRVTPHVLRHTCAMNLLQAGVDIATIALWLGHADIRATQIYLHADLALKERALARTTPPHTAPGRYQPPDALLAFLEQL
jgi:site-specific recombinase XerD